MNSSEPPKTKRKRTNIPPYVTILTVCFALLCACNISPVPSPTGSSGGQTPVEFGDSSMGGAEDTTLEDIQFGAADTGIQTPDNDNNVKTDISPCSPEADGEMRVDTDEIDGTAENDSESSHIPPDAETDAPSGDDVCP